MTPPLLLSLLALLLLPAAPATAAVVWRAPPPLPARPLQLQQRRNTTAANATADAGTATAAVAAARPEATAPVRAVNDAACLASGQTVKINVLANDEIRDPDFSIDLFLPGMDFGNAVTSLNIYDGTNEAGFVFSDSDLWEDEDTLESWQWVWFLQGCSGASETCNRTAAIANSYMLYTPPRMNSTRGVIRTFIYQVRGWP